MDMKLKDRFMVLWKKYFGAAELPMAFYYTDDETRGKRVKAPAKGHQCIIGVLNKVRQGQVLRFGHGSFGCSGAERYLGYTEEVTRLDFFISIPGNQKKVSWVCSMCRRGLLYPKTH